MESQAREGRSGAEMSPLHRQTLWRGGSLGGGSLREL